MPDVLSQQEIDSLLTGLNVQDQQAEESVDTTSPPRDFMSYDFRRPNRISKNQVRTIQTVHEA
ncbi:MAG: flagellar motor switch protein FliM, partial [Candidatus Kapaibacterium sp.]